MAQRSRTATMGGKNSGERLASLETLLNSTLEQLPANIKLAVQDGIREVIQPLTARLDALERVAAQFQGSTQTKDKISDQAQEWGRTLLPYVIAAAGIYFGMAQHH